MDVSGFRLIPCILLMSLLATTYSCHSQTNSHNKNSEEQSQTNAPQIAEYVVEIFEDSKGNLWFGTIPNGAACYDGKTLTYLSTKDGLTGNTVTSFAEDKDGNLWIGTHSGLSKYDGKKFTNFTDKDGLVNNRVSELLIDKKGILWIGTWGGVSRHDPSAELRTGFTTFSTFTIPNPDISLLPYNAIINMVTEIIEDKQGNIWFARDGYGACKYDGKSFTHYTKQDGLASTSIHVICEDKNGNLWFGSRIAERDNPDKNGRTGDGGLSRLDPSASLSTGSKTFIQFPEIKGLSKNEIYEIYEDHNGNIWIGANGLGVYRYDPGAHGEGGKDFKLFSKTDRADLMPYGYGIQSILEDKKGNLWFGLSGGLFRLKGDSIINVTQNGPWN